MSHNQDNNSVSMFLRAAAKGDLALVKRMYERGIDVNKISSEGNTALYLASSFGHIPIVKMLLDAGANLNFQDSRQGWTSLMAAVKSGHFEVVKLLVNSGADLKKEDYQQRTALMLAVEFGHLQIAQFLMAYVG